MNIRSTSVIVFMVLLAGCAIGNGLSAKGQDLSKGPANNQDVLGHIRFLEKVNGRAGCPVEVLRVEDRGEELTALVEFWIVRSCGVKTVYKVRKAPLGHGQYKYTVTYPSAADLMTLSNY